MWSCTRFQPRAFTHTHTHTQQNDLNIGYASCVHVKDCGNCRHIQDNDDQRRRPQPDRRFGTESRTTTLVNTGGGKCSVHAAGLRQSCKGRRMGSRRPLVILDHRCVHHCVDPIFARCAVGNLAILLAIWQSGGNCGGSPCAYVHLG